MSIISQKQLITSDLGAVPDWQGLIPICSRDCPQHDGNCKLTGFRTERYCEPVLEYVLLKDKMINSKY